MGFTLRNARLVDTSGEVAPGALTVEGARIGTPDQVAAPGASIDLGGAIVTPGFIDLHVHGGGGFALHTTEAGEIAAEGTETRIWARKEGDAQSLTAVAIPEDAKKKLGG